MEVAVNLAQEQGQLRAEMRLWSTFDVAGFCRVELPRQHFLGIRTKRYI